MNPIRKPLQFVLLAVPLAWSAVPRLSAPLADDCLWVEGQGSLLNPASTATIPLIRGTPPTHLILAHRGGMRTLQEFPDITIPPLEKVVELFKMVAAAGGSLPRVPVVGIALNTWGLDESAAQAEIAAARATTRLPTTDVVRFGAAPLLDAVLT